MTSNKQSAWGEFKDKNEDWAHWKPEDYFDMGYDAGLKASGVDGNTSDGYHTFSELYDHRRILTMSLFNMEPESCLKSKLHYDGTMFDNYFIVGILTMKGWATYHYHLDFWNDFKCGETIAFPEWDGHTATDAINRIRDHFDLNKGSECESR